MEEDKIILAGKIAGTALAHGKKYVKAGVSHIEIAQKVEEKIYSMGGKLAFPVCMSINHVAAHAVPPPNDTTLFKETDIVKLDVGVHVDGWVADNATTIDISGKYKDLTKASYNALQNAIKAVKVGGKVSEVGRAIQDTITDAGFAPIKNLSGHSIEHYVVHAGMTVPNYDNGDKTTFKAGMQIAIEPFATTGDGVIVEGKGGGIFRIQAKRATRSPQAKAVLAFLDKEYKTLPFSKRAVNLPMRDFAFNVLEKEGIIYQYPELVERAKGMVTQAEHSLLITEKGVKVITQVD